MGWPKGKPRKGHVNKDGSLHKLKKTLKATGARGSQRRVNTALALLDKRLLQEAPAKRNKKWATKLVHPAYIIEQCPNCEFPEADGGFCAECGWSAPVVRLPAGSVIARRF